jgi:glutathione S-transferase
MHRLFYVAGSPYARMARIAVAELGLGDRIAEVETTLRDPASTLLPFNPVGRVPALVLPDGATVLTETAVILPYLDRVSGRPPLLPLDGGEAGLRVLSGYGRVTGLLDGIAVWNRELRRPEHERSPGVIALEVARANRVADALEREVAEGTGFAGPGVDAACIALACALGYCERRHTVWRWREGRPALSAWLDGFAPRPSFQATLPPPSGI